MDIRFRPIEIASCVAQMSKFPIGNLLEPATESMQFDHQENEMTRDDAMRNKPVLYWAALAIMFAAFIAVALS